jgi:hypothetical protein
METIKAQVNQKLLSKTTRLFTGTLAGRIIEILQNARRAGATEVRITNEENRVIVRDNGGGIDDFSKLLDLGNSDWDQGTEVAEDPAGVGVFCLAPREVQISSGHKSVVITEKAWTGEPVPVQAMEDSSQGTTLQFADGLWTMDEVEKYAAFSGLKVIVDGKECASEPFVSDHAIPHPELGCRVEVRRRKAITKWHQTWKCNYYSDDVLVNFHGQVLQFHFAPIREELQYLVDLTGEPTSIRLMLPARTQIVENEAFGQLKSIMEKEVYKYLQKRGSHQLTYAKYCRAQELGIELPEATPAFQVGLLYEEGVEPIEVTKPDDFSLDRCFLMSRQCRDDSECNEANAHLLAALSKFDSPFVPVEISPGYKGYTWAKIPTIDQLEVKVGKEIRRQYLWAGLIIAVESLEIIARTSDGKAFKSAMAIAIQEPAVEKDKSCYVDTEVLVTLDARESLDPSDIWYHLGGYSDEGDSYDTQLCQFKEALGLFWSTLIGPGEYLRTRLLNCLRSFDLDWQTIAIHSNGTLSLTHKDGTKETVPHPEPRIPHASQTNQ